MADYEVLAPGGHENLINNVTERLDEKAYIDGYYAQLTAGAADSLTGRGDGVSASYLYRTTGGDADVADGTATVKSIHGRTVVWNQLVDTPYVSTSGETSGITFTIIDGKRVTAVGTSTAGTNFYFFTDATSKMTAVNGHKYLVRGITKFVTDGTARVAIYYDGSLRHSVTQDSIITATASGIARCYLNIGVAGVTVDADVTPQLFDLTRMFGAGNEPSTVAEFEALYPEPYYPYDAGSLLSVQMEGIETVGFNQWDEEWELGSFNNTTGVKVSASDTIRSKNLIPVFGSTEYYFGDGANAGIWVWGYDAAENYVGRIGRSGEIGDTYTIKNAAITIPAGISYINISLPSAYGTTYNNDICINLSWSGYRNGEYEPYWKSERTIPATNLRSVGTVYDELTSDAAVTRVGAVDLGTLTWVAATDSVGQYFYSVFSGYNPPSGTSVAANATCAKYPTVPANNIGDGELALGANGTQLFIRDTTYADAAAFTTAMSGVYLFYAIATPTTQAIDPPLNLSYKVSDFGTERIMVPVNEQSAPPTQQVVYGLNVVDTVRRLPTEYISHDSFTQFRIALGAKLGVFIIETWDETDNRYEYTINDA